jgi:hypothetical protein
MSGSTENTARGASEKTSGRSAALNLATARRMLPLVQRIIRDLLEHRQRVLQLLPEQDRLNRRRQVLAWPERARRYQVQEELADASRLVQEALTELTSLGVVLVNMEEGRVGFPTVVNGRPAYFSWRNGEEGLHSWHFPEESGRRPIPASWARSANISLSAKG